MYMKKMSEGRKMFIIVMSIFIVYAAVFIIFDDFDRNKLLLLDDVAERHLPSSPLCPANGCAHTSRTDKEGKTDTPADDTKHIA